MFKLNCKVKIGKDSFTSVNQVKIKRSIHSFIDTATIILPVSANLKQYNERQTESLARNEKPGKTSSFFEEGNAVEIWLGYEDDLRLEFKGLVKRVNAATPCEIECEGYSWQLKRKSILKDFPTVLLKDLLNFLREGTDIVLSNDIPDITLRQVYFKNISGTDVLDYLKKNFYMNVYFEGNVLYAGSEWIKTPRNATYKADRELKTADLPADAYEPVEKPVGYTMGFNVVKDDQLKFRKAADVHVEVKAICYDDKNEAKPETAGDRGGAIVNIYVPEISTADQLKTIAENKVKQLKYDGYEGKLTGFLQPYAFPGYQAVLRDDKFEGRNGKYLIESTEVSFGRDGGRRICEIGIKTGEIS